MPVLVPVGDQPIPNGYSDPPNDIETFVLNTGDSVTWGHASASPGVPTTISGFDSYLMEDGTPNIVVGRHTLWTETNVTYTYTATRPIGLLLRLLIGGGATGDGMGVARGYHAETTLLPAGNCAYGTRPKAQYSGILNITPALIDVVLQRYGASWLQRVLAQLLYGTIDTAALCGAGPPPLPTVDTSTLQASAQTALAIWQALLWAEVCECVPGDPAPTPYPPYTLTEPAGWPPALTFTCSEEELCAALVKLQQGLAVLQTTLTSNYELTTLLQRYSLPMAFINGPTHPNLAGSVAFQVSRLLGVRVTLRGSPGGLQTFTGVPPYVTDLGWLSIVTGSGLVDEIRFTRAEQLWMPRLMPMAVSFAVALRDGVAVDVQELLAEP